MTKTARYITNKANGVPGSCIKKARQMQPRLFTKPIS